MGKSTTSLAIFNSKLLVYQRVINIYRFHLRYKVTFEREKDGFHPSSVGLL